MREKFKPHYPGKNQHYAKNPSDVAGLVEKQDAKDGGSQDPDPGPDGVACPYGEGLQSLCQKIEAQEHAGYRENAGIKPGEAFRILQADCPGSLENACYEKNKPFHKPPSSY